MAAIIKKLFILVTGLSLCFSAWANNCAAEKARFRELYIALQQSLNYEGKDAVLVNGKLILKPHTQNSAYEGKVFEEALYKEYQLSLKKVAAVYQAARFEQFEKTNSALVEFMQAVDGNDSAVSEYVKKNKVDQVIDQLQEASKKKFSQNKNALINDHDKYLLKKLLTHAQDRICSVSKFEEIEQKTGKQQRLKSFSASELNRIRNAPLNRLINAIKKGNIQADSDLKLDDLKDTPKAITETIAKNLAALKEWKKKNEKCLKDIANPSFIQSGIQLCNYNLFVQTLDKNTEHNIESILHFINANERFLKNPSALAETALDEMKLEAAIDQSFNDVSKKSDSCPQFSKKNNRVFISNLTYNESRGFDLSHVKLSCSRSGVIVDSKSCQSNLELISDQNGEGVEVRLKKSNATSVKLEQLVSCEGSDASAPVVLGSAQESNSGASEERRPAIDSQASTIKPPVLTAVQNDEIKPAIGSQAATRPQDPSRLSEALRQNQRQTITPSASLASSDITEAATGSEPAQTTIIPATEASASQTVTNVENQKCVEVNGKKQVLNPTSKKCEEKITEADCKAKEKGDQKFIYRENENRCDPVKTQKDCDKENKDGKSFKLNSEKNTCEEVKAEEKLSAEEQCIKDNELWISNQLKEGNAPSSRHVWDAEKKTCRDKHKKETETAEESDEEEAPQSKIRSAPSGQIPQRFVPINIPSRQMYILPGMP